MESRKEKNDHNSTLLTQPPAPLHSLLQQKHLQCHNMIFLTCFLFSLLSFVLLACYQAHTHTHAYMCNIHTQQKKGKICINCKDSIKWACATLWPLCMCSINIWFLTNVDIIRKGTGKPSENLTWPMVNPLGSSHPD